MRRDYTLNGLRPVFLPDLLRAGNAHGDGGYVIAKRQIAHTRVLIGLGLSYDWSFEEDFKNANPSAALYCYDYSIGAREFLTAGVSAALEIFGLKSLVGVAIGKRSVRQLLTKPIREFATYRRFSSFFDERNGVTFVKKGVSDHASDVMITVDDMFARIAGFDALPADSIFIKMDIEGAEYDVLPDLLRQKERINGGVIEFHHLKYAWNDFAELIALIREDFEVIHVHGNNLSGYIPNTRMPAVLEVSFIKRALVSPEELREVNDRAYPLAGLDRPNAPALSDLNISFSE